MTEPRIRTDGERFELIIESLRVPGKFHTVWFPVNKPEVLMQYLLKRQARLAQTDSDLATIGEAASPTQAQVEAWLKADTLRKEQEKAEADKKWMEEVANKYGITEEELKEIEL